MARKTKKEVVWEFRCAEILGSARKVFAKKGYANATMDEIAAATGLAKGTLYLYFKSKRDVYLRTLQHGSAELLETAEADMQKAAGVRAKIRALIAASVRYADENRDFFRIYVTEFNTVTHPASINREFRDLLAKQGKAVEEVLRNGVEAGEIQQLDVEATAFTIQDMARSLIVRRLLGWSRNNAEQDVDFLCNFVWRALGG